METHYIYVVFIQNVLNNVIKITNTGALCILASMSKHMCIFLPGINMLKNLKHMSAMMGKIGGNGTGTQTGGGFRAETIF